MKMNIEIPAVKNTCKINSHELLWFEYLIYFAMVLKKTDEIEFA